MLINIYANEITTMKNVLGKLLGIISLVLLIGSSISDAGTIHIASNDETIDLINSKSYLLVLFYGDKCDKPCLEAMKELERVAETSLITDLKIVTNEGHVVAESYGLKKYPTIMFYRDGYPILYPVPLVEADDLVIWMEQSRSVSTKILTDHTFEHDTQASTGATTGDWFVMFYSKTCNKLTATWEALANELKHRMNVAKVDINKNLGLSNRFSVTKCPTLIFFRAGKMYRYDLPEKDFNSLLSFANGWYKNAQAEKVAREPSPFDELTTSIADGIKERLDGPYSTYYIIGGFVAVFVALFSTALYCCMGREEREKFD